MVSVLESDSNIIQMKEAMIQQQMNYLSSPRQSELIVATIDLTGGTNYPLTKWREYYQPLEDMNVELIDAVKLQADVVYGGKWYSKSGKLLDELLRIRMKDLEVKYKMADKTTASYVIDEKELVNLNNYFQLPDNQKWSHDTIRDKFTINHVTTEIITPLIDNYLLFMADRNAIIHHPSPSEK